MAHGPEYLAALKSGYLAGLGLEIAAEKAGIPYATARNWYRKAKAEGQDWDKFRAANLNAGLIVAGGTMEQAIGRVVAAVILEAEATVEHLHVTEELDPLVRTQAIASLTDSLNKAANIARKGMPEADKLATINETIKGVADLFIRLHPSDAGKMVAVIEAWAGGAR
ncbi:DUF1804 family protein [Propionivibrio sp.]|uniref:DUF1804 family protein n=1 Tax=Propionivibrio sp. TaxID=2212460 RepID=UPI003BF24DDD